MTQMPEFPSKSQLELSIQLVLSSASKGNPDECLKHSGA